MKGCRDCENAIFVERVGEYKCKLRKVQTKCEDNLRCKYWKKGTPEKSKVDEKEVE